MHTLRRYCYICNCRSRDVDPKLYICVAIKSGQYLKFSIRVFYTFLLSNTTLEYPPTSLYNNYRILHHTHPRLRQP